MQERGLRMLLLQVRNLQQHFHFEQQGYLQPEVSTAFSLRAVCPTSSQHDVASGPCLKRHQRQGKQQLSGMKITDCAQHYLSVLVDLISLSTAGACRSVTDSQTCSMIVTIAV